MEFEEHVCGSDVFQYYLHCSWPLPTLDQGIKTREMALDAQPIAVIGFAPVFFALTDGGSQACRWLYRPMLIHSKY